MNSPVFVRLSTKSADNRAITDIKYCEEPGKLKSENQLSDKYLRSNKSFKVVKNNNMTTRKE